MLVRLMEGFPPFFRDEGDGLPLPGSRSAHYAYPLRHLYTPGMPLLHALLHLLTYFMNQRMPELHRHLEEAGLEPATWASQWFLTLFTYSFPRFVWERGWDMCFAEIGEQIETGSDAAGGEESSQAMKSSPNTTGKPKKTYYLPRTLLILALSALEHAKPRLLETSDAEVLLQLLRGDRICNDFERCRQVVDLAADWCQDESVVEVTEVRKKMREFWKSIVDRVNSRSASPTGGRSSADAAPPPPDKRGKVGGGQSRIFGFLRGRDSQTGPDLQELKAALLMWQRRAEAAENEVEHLRAELFDAKMNTPRGGTPPHPRDDEEWRAEKEMWREEVLRLTRETDVRETELLRWVIL